MVLIACSRGLGELARVQGALDCELYRVGMDIVQTSLSHPPLLNRNPFLSSPRQLKEEEEQQPKQQEQIIPLLSSSSDIERLQSKCKTTTIQDQIQLTSTFPKLGQEHYSQNSQSHHQPKICGMNNDNQQWIPKIFIL